MAMLCKDEYPTLDMDKVIKMCLIHDFGEAVTGDIPAFYKNEENEKEEQRAVGYLLSKLSENTACELRALFDEMNALESEESKLYKALDNLEAIVSHNEADISMWIEMEYEENLVYGKENCEWSQYTKDLREILRLQSIKKIEEAKN